MKKSLTKLLARMAKDGDVETVAEILGEMIGNTEDPDENPAEKAAEPAAEEPVTLEVPENREIIVDEDSLGGILQRLDRIIELLAPAPPATDEDPDGLAGEIAEIVEETAEAAEAEAAPTAAEQIAQIVEEVIEPAVSTALGEREEDSPPAEGKDALRAALQAIRPVLAVMPRKQRQKVCADLAASLRPAQKARDGGVYAALAASRRAAPGDSAELGKRIMSSRNPNYVNKASKCMI